MPLPYTSLTPTNAPASGTMQAIFDALSESSEELIGTAKPELLVIPIHDDGGTVRGGLWGWTMFEWLDISLLFIPAPLRHRGFGSHLIAIAEQEARRRGCRGVHLAAFSFQAGPFYEKCGYSCFAVLDDLPPGHSQRYFQKRLCSKTGGADE